MDGGLQILTNFGQKCDELEGKRKNREEIGEGKGGRTERAGRRVYMQEDL